jgi:hypothetical protein
MSEPGVGRERDDGAEPYGFGDPIRWFRDQPARIFAVLATLLFVLGWAGVISVTFWSDANNGGPSTTLQRIQFAISLGSAVTLATSALWIVAALLWRRR